jgi:hypothetical protein
MIIGDTNRRAASIPLMKLGVCLVAMTLLWTTVLNGQQSAKASNWDGWQFLLGEWVGEGGGGPGQGGGGYTFLPDLQNTVLVRKNFAEYPAQKDKPAYRHDDLMIVYHSGDGSSRAIYFDNEGHIINYDIAFSPDSSSVVFLSGIIPSEPRYRLTYSRGLNEVVEIRFEIAPQGKPDAFSKYIEAKARRK